MTTQNKENLIRSMLGDETAKVSDCLIQAESAILNRLYPYEDREDDAEVPDRYTVLACQLAVRVYLRKGAEGEISHSEPDVSRTYDSPNDEDLLSEVTPYARFI